MKNLMDLFALHPDVYIIKDDAFKGICIYDIGFYQSINDLKEGGIEEIIEAFNNKELDNPQPHNIKIVGWPTELKFSYFYASEVSIIEENTILIRGEAQIQSSAMLNKMIEITEYKNRVKTLENEIDELRLLLAEKMILAKKN
jgi:hypothetical protein